jgi:hypothetical protein
MNMSGGKHVVNRIKSQVIHEGKLTEPFTGIRQTCIFFSYSFTHLLSTDLCLADNFSDT